MESLTLSSLVCALNLYFAQKLPRKAKLARGCRNHIKLLQSCRAQSGQVSNETNHAIRSNNPVAGVVDKAV